MFTFQSNAGLLKAFRGYQGPEPTMSRVVFLGKDANFPDFQKLSEDQSTAIIKFLEGKDWKTGKFRTSRSHKNRNENRKLAHHPIQLACFPGNRDGASYHRRIAELFDNLHDEDENITPSIFSFVELICTPTNGNIHRWASESFRGKAPPQLNAPADYKAKQEAHRTKLLEWLLDKKRLVIMPRSVFKIIKENRWSEEPDKLVFREEPSHADSGPFYDLRLKDRSWVVTSRFPYFPRGSTKSQIKEEIESLGIRIREHLEQGK